MSTRVHGLTDEAFDGCWMCDEDGLYEVAHDGCGLFCPICERVMVEPASPAADPQEAK